MAMRDLDDRLNLDNITVASMAGVIEKSVQDLRINIAVCGQSGTGKSSFINSFLNLKPGDKGYVKVSIVECTKVRAKFQRPDVPQVIMWDLPGMGAPGFNEEQYMRKYDFPSYDAFIIIFSERVSQYDLRLAETATRFEKPFFFVRCKVDQDILASKEKLGPNNAMKKMRKDCQEFLKKYNLADQKIYLISNAVEYQLKYDLPSLIDELINKFPDQSRKTMIITMLSCSKEIIAEKKAILLEGVPYAARLAVDRDEYNIKLIYETLQYYISIFGVSDSNMAFWEVDIRKFPPEIQEMKKGLDWAIETAQDTPRDFREKVAHTFAKFPFLRNMEWAKKQIEKDEGPNEKTISNVFKGALELCESLAIRILEERHVIAETKLLLRLGYAITKYSDMFMTSIRELLGH